MLDNHQIELVHADVDGELPAGQRGELSRLLLANPEARALHDELRRLSRLLDGLPKLDPPAGLASAVLDGIPWPQAARSAAPAVSWWHTAPRIAAAMAAGALLTATVYQLARPFGDDVDGSEVSGTMASPASAPKAVARALELNLEQVKGTVAVSGSIPARTIDFDVAIAVPVEVVAIAGGVENLYQLEPSAGRVRRSFRLEGKPDHAVDLEFYAAGTSLGRARVELGP